MDNDAVLENMGLVYMVANGLRGRGLDHDDLVNEGVIGLMNAVKLFDPSRNIRFSTYAVHAIRRSIMRAIQDKGDAIRVPASTARDLAAWRQAETEIYLETGHRPDDERIAERAGLNPNAKGRVLKALAASRAGGEALGMDRGTIDGPEHAWEPEEYAELERRPASLDERQRLVLSLRLGLGDGPGMTLTQASERSGVTRERVR
jgi:RNA polymerase primary sigma factor